MIEIIVLDHLAASLSVPAYMEFPSNPSSRFVVLRKTDTERDDWIETAQFVADSYAESLLEAAKLNIQVKEAMDAATQLDSVAASYLVSDYPFPDHQNKHYRYQAVYKITHYEE